MFNVTRSALAVIVGGLLAATAGYAQTTTPDQTSQSTSPNAASSPHQRETVKSDAAEAPTGDSNANQSDASSSQQKQTMSKKKHHRKKKSSDQTG